MLSFPLVGLAPSTSVHTRCAPKLAYYAISNSTVTSLLWSAAYLLCSHDEGSIIALHAEKAKQRVATWTQLFLLHVYCNNYYRSLQIVLQTILLLNPLQKQAHILILIWWRLCNAKCMHSNKSHTTPRIQPIRLVPKKNCNWGGLIDPIFYLTAFFN